MTHQVKHRRQMRDERYKERFDTYKAGSKNPSQVILDVQTTPKAIENMTVKEINQTLIAKLKDAKKGQRDVKITLDDWNYEFVLPRDADYLYEHNELPQHIIDQVNNSIKIRKENMEKDIEVANLNENLIKSIINLNKEDMKKLQSRYIKIGELRDDKEDIIRKSIAEKVTLLEEQTGKKIKEDDAWRIRNLIRAKDANIMKMDEEVKKYDKERDEVLREAKRIGWSRYFWGDDDIDDISNWNKIKIKKYYLDEQKNIKRSNDEEETGTGYGSGILNGIEKTKRTVNALNYNDESSKVKSRLREYKEQRENRLEKKEMMKTNPKPVHLTAEEIEKLL